MMEKIDSEMRGHFQKKNKDSAISAGRHYKIFC